MYVYYLIVGCEQKKQKTRLSPSRPSTELPWAAARATDIGPCLQRGPQGALPVHVSPNASVGLCHRNAGYVRAGVARLDAKGRHVCGVLGWGGKVVMVAKSSKHILKGRADPCEPWLEPEL